MRFGNAEIPEDLRYTKNHLWVKSREGFCALGWTDYIQQNAGDVNYVDLPPKGSAMEVGEEFGTIAVQLHVLHQIFDHPLSCRLALPADEVALQHVGVDQPACPGTGRIHGQLLSNRRNPHEGNRDEQRQTQPEQKTALPFQVRFAKDAFDAAV